METKILILEGPAGSGKTYLLERQERIQRIPKNEMPRDFGIFSAQRSMLNDHEKLIRAIGWSGDRPIVLDRCFFSQFIYESIRQRESLNFCRPLYREAWPTLIQLIQVMSKEYEKRVWISNPPKISIRVLFLIPLYGDLILFRSRDSKEYPFSPEEELNRYKLMAEVTPGAICHTPAPGIVNPSLFNSLFTRGINVQSL